MKRTGGFVLLSTMLVALVLAMILRAAMLRMPSALASTEQGVMTESAIEAAHSGLEYALSRLKSDPHWTGGEGRVRVIDQPAVKVEEEQGNVRGVLLGLDGTRSEFRIRFNCQDGPEGIDAQPDPSAEFTFKLPYLSLNNLEGNVERPTWRQAGEGLEVAPYQAPAHSVSLAVEGISYRGTRQVSRVVEAVYELRPDRKIDDAVIMAAAEMQFQMNGNGGVELGGEFADGALRLRTKKSLEIQGPGRPGELRIDEPSRAEIGRDEASGGIQALFDPTRVSQVQESRNDGKDFYNLPWENLALVDPDPRSRKVVRIPGGVYVYGQKLPVGSHPNRERELRYYDMSYDDYLAQADSLARDPKKGIVLSENLKQVRDSTKLKNGSFGAGPGIIKYRSGPKDKVKEKRGFYWSLEGVDMKVLPSDKGETAFNLVPRRPAKMDGDDDTVYPTLHDRYNPDHMKISLKDATIQVEGDVRLQGAVGGSGGTLVSAGDVELLGGRSMSFQAEGDPDSVDELQQTLDDGLDAGDLGAGEGSDSSLEICVYSKGSLTVSTYVERLDRYRDMSFKGLLYSWGDVALIAGRQGNPTAGLVELTGALVAYGGDPVGEEPGKEEMGKVRVSGSQAILNWDPRFLPSLTSLEGEGYSHFTLHRTVLHERR